MSSAERIYLQASSPDVASRCAALGLRVEMDHGWCLLGGAEGLDRARALSVQLDVPVVFWSIHSVVDQIWIVCCEGGKDTRTLRYSSAEGWSEQRGKPRPFEHRALKAWLKRGSLSARSDGDDILACFLGRDRPPLVEIVEPGANLEFFLTPQLVKEAQDVARAHACSLSEVMHAAWELGKHALLARHEGSAREIFGSDYVAPVLAAAAPPFEPTTTMSLHALPDSHDKVSCRLAVPAPMLAEIRAMLMALDRTGSMLLGEAYLIARDRFVRLGQPPASP